MSSVLARLSAAAKAHHDSVNNAYEFYYTGSVTPRASVEHKRSSSTSSTSSTASMGKAWNSVKKAAKQHHDSVNAAVDTLYLGGVTPRQSYERARSVESEDVAKAPIAGNGNGGKKMWESVKRHAKEHHRSVNAATEVLYSGGRKWETQ
ncbi:hypothetical protein BDV96DRAFT_577190 [Lophiotrema nucula]|uniref:Uncharacterized protein n=1 Tax=Lophiotrema nucula TaxID=690887 RepID=A0A6A5Z5N9_9PLEO|nr:hypothetical protein BDV96DRAFT_577190 [Lophiotrema nucula]